MFFEVISPNHASVSRVGKVFGQSARISFGDPREGIR